MTITGCPPCDDGDHATIEDGLCTCCGTEMLAPSHDCGLCDGPLVFAGMCGVYPTFRCRDSACDWWHIAKDCCEIPAVLTR